MDGSNGELVNGMLIPWTETKRRMRELMTKRNPNPQDAMVGDLIMWTSNHSGFNFGKIISFNSNGVPMVRPIRLPWFEDKRLVGFKYVPDEVNGYWRDIDGERVKVRLEAIYEEVNIQHPLRYGRGYQAGYNWMVIAYGPNNPKSRTVEELHPIALAKQQFAELETKVQGAF